MSPFECEGVNPLRRADVPRRNPKVDQLFVTPAKAGVTKGRIAPIFSFSRSTRFYLER